MLTHKNTLNLYILRVNRLARKRQIQDAIYNGLACVVTSYLSMLFAYWLFSFPTLYLGFANYSSNALVIVRNMAGIA